jgi:hypothetical protein
MVLAVFLQTVLDTLGFSTYWVARVLEDVGVQTRWHFIRKALVLACAFVLTWYRVEFIVVK